MNSTTVTLSSLERERSSLADSGRLHWFHWAIIILSAVLTVGAWYFSKSQVEENTAAQFQRESAQIVELITERMTRYEDALVSGVAAIVASGGEMSHSEWRTFAASLQIETKYPGINGIGIVARVARNQLDEYIAEQRVLRPEYSVHPAHAESEFLPIVYIEPEAPNAKAVGLDMAHEKNRYSAALKARDTGTAQITGPIVLVQDSERTPGFLFYQPYYAGQNSTSLKDRRKNFVGMVYAPFVVKNLMAGTLEKHKRRVGVRLTDGGEVLYDENTSEEPEFDMAPLYSENIELPFYGRAWSLGIQSTKTFRKSNENNQPAFILIGGITIDLLLITMFVMLTRASRRTLAFADKMTVELRLQAKELTQSNAELESFAYVASHDLKTPLRGIADLTEYLTEDLAPYTTQPDSNPDISKNLDRLVRQTDRMDNLIKGIMSYSSVGTRQETVELVDARKLIRSIAKNLGAHPDQVTIEGDIPIFETDVVRFEQVVSNLMGNAFKYNPDKEGARVTVKCESNGGFFHFTVGDNGPGIEPKFHSRIFEVFQTLQPKDEIESTGIGLSIVKKSVEALGGSVSVSSVLGTGTTFHFDWPKAIRRNQKAIYAVNQT